jgi:hypothetical protein
MAPPGELTNPLAGYTPATPPSVITITVTTLFLKRNGSLD